MQRFDRSGVEPPRFLASPEASAARAQLLELFSGSRERLAQTRVPLERLSLEDSSVVESLSRLFHGKCAFCEAPEASGVHRFRPPSEATPIRRTDTAHLYYAWLSDAWENLYLICETCRPSRADAFPVKGNRAPLPPLEHIRAYVQAGTGVWGRPVREVSLLIDPCSQRDYTPHFHVQADGLLRGLTDRGRATVDHFQLNRLERVEDRRHALEQLTDALLEFIAPAPNTPPGADAGTELFDFRDLSFGGVWYLYLKRICVELARREGTRPNLSQARIGSNLAQRRRRRSGRAEVLQAIEALRAHDDAGPPLTPEIGEPSHTSARLTHVEVRNFKGLESLALAIGDAGSDTDHRSRPAPAILVLGENAAGKSSLLEAIALALSRQQAREGLNLDAERLRLDPQLMGDPEGPRAATAEVLLRFEDGEPRHLQIDARGISALGRQDLPPVFAYGAFRQYLAGRRRYSPSRSIISLFRTDSLLSNPEEWLLSLSDVDFNMVVRALREIISVEGEFEVMRRNPDRRQCLVVTATTSGGAGMVHSETPLSLVSSGFRAVLAMVCDILMGLMDERVSPAFETFNGARGVVLIDEIEAHLHPRWKMQIMAGLRRALPQMTFIATTHDPLCLRGMLDGEVVVLHRVAGAGTDRTRLPIFVEQLTELPNVANLTIEQLLTSDFFSMFSTDAPETERELARVADLLTKRQAEVSLTLAERAALEQFEANVASALPVGSNEVQREVQAAVAEFLKRKREQSAERLADLRIETRERIIRALEGL